MLVNGQVLDGALMIKVGRKMRKGGKRTIEEVGRPREMAHRVSTITSGSRERLYPELATWCISASSSENGAQPEKPEFRDKAS